MIYLPLPESVSDIWPNFNLTSGNTMARLLEINWDPNARQLRQFAGACVIAIPLIAWIWGAGGATIGILALISLVVGLAGFVVPRILKPLYVAASLFAMPIGLLISELMLMTIFFGVIAPLGLVFRMLKRDALNLKRKPAGDTYWLQRKQVSDPLSYYHQS